MKRFALMGRTILCALMFIAGTARAQTLVTPTNGSGLVTLGTVSATGQVGSTITFAGAGFPPTTHTVEYSVAGTVPSACTLQLEGSLDNVHWYSLSGSLSCLSGTMTHVVSKPVVYARVNVLTYTAGDGTTAVSVRYLRGDL